MGRRSQRGALPQSIFFSFVTGRSGGCGALKRGHSAPLETLAKLGDALGGVGAVTLTNEAAERVIGQAAKGRRSVRQWALTQKLGAAAHLSWEILVSLRTAATAEAPLSPMWFPQRLRGEGRGKDGERAAVSTGFCVSANTRGGDA